MNAKLLIIGAGIGQVPLLEKARNRGIHTTVVSKRGDYPGFALADEIFYEDIYNCEAIAQYAQAHGITAVLSDQNDLTMPTVAYVAEHLGLPGNTYDQITAYCYKSRFRRRCESLGIPVPRHVSLHTDVIPSDFQSLPLPWIVKPEDMQSSIGVSKIERQEDVQQAVRNALEKSSSHRAILEEYFRGREVVCEGFVIRGQYRLLAFGDRKYFDLQPLFIPSQTLFPSRLPDRLKQRIVACEQALAADIGLSFGIIHSEYLVDEERGEIRVVESAPRGGGVYISSHLIPLATGIDVNEVLLRCALGENVDVDKIWEGRIDRAAGYVCFYLPEGEILSVEGLDELRQDPFVAATYLENIRVGVCAGKMLNKGMRKGPILVFGEDRDRLEDHISEIQKTLHVFGRSTDGHVEGIHWE